jgi:hypothetical protein
MKLKLMRAWVVPSKVARTISIGPAEQKRAARRDGKVAAAQTRGKDFAHFPVQINRPEIFLGTGRGQSG